MKNLIKKKIDIHTIFNQGKQNYQFLNTTAHKPVISNRLPVSEAVNPRFITAGRKLLEGEAELSWARNQGTAL